MAGLEDLTPADQAAHRLGALLLNKNPDIAREAKRLAKKADPTLRIPEIELEDEINKASEKTAKRVEELEQQVIAQDVAQRRREFRAECEKQGLKPEDVEKIVVDEKCSTSTALKLALAQRETAEPGAAEVYTNPVGTPVDMRPDKEVRKLSGNALRRWSSDLAHSMVDQFKTQRRAQTR